MPRPHPFTLVFADIAAERFPAIREALGDRRDVTSFLMASPAIDLLHDLRPDEGLGDAMDDFVAFVHAAFVFWDCGADTHQLDEAATRRLIEPRAPNHGGAARLLPGEALYIQVAPRRIWSRLGESDIHEPLDGWFAIAEADGLRMVACLGVHPSRPGLTVLTAAGPRPATLLRVDGSAAYAPLMDGGDAAGLASVANADELLELGWRSWPLRRPD